MKSRLLTLLSACVLAANTVFGFDLVTNGVSCVRFENAEGTSRALATNDFWRIIGKVTGAKPTTDAKNVIAFKVDPSIGASDTYELRVESAELRVEGGEKVEIVGNNERSCWFGTCALLEQLGCRWFWPGETGEYLPAATKDLKLEVKPVKTTATFPSRHLAFHPTRGNKVKNWFVAHNRMNQNGGSGGGLGALDWGQQRGWGGHSFNWVKPSDCKDAAEYFAKYPEQHALWQGKRVKSQHCYSDPKAFATFVEFFSKVWDEHPDIDYIGLSPKDTPIHCTCENCSKMDPSTLYFDFINRLVAKLDEKYPCRRYTTIAYSFYVKPPKVKIRENIEMTYCMYNRCYAHPFGDADCPVNPGALGEMAKWSEVLGHAPGIYGYHFDVWSAPEPYAAFMEEILQDELKWARDHGVRHFQTEDFGNFGYSAKDRDIAFRYPIYCLLRLLWNPDTDLETVKADWCAHVYGAAAPEMARYLTEMERAWKGMKAHPRGYNASPAFYCEELLTGERIERVDGLFAEAERKLAASGDERGKGELALEKAFWDRWRALRKSRTYWFDVAANPDTNRLDRLEKAPKGVKLYPVGAKEPTEFVGFSRKDGADGHVLGNHPRCFTGEAWLNFEWEADFRIPSGQVKPDRPGFTLKLRGNPAEHYTQDDHRGVWLRFDNNAYHSEIYIKHGTPSIPIVKRTKFATPLSGEEFHHLSVRLVDTRLVVKIDGNELYRADGVPMSTGRWNVQTGGRLDLKNVEVHAIRLPEDPLTPFEINTLKGKKARIDGTGAVIYE